MDKALADAFMHFYQTLLKPEFDALKTKLAEHDKRFEEILTRCELEEANWRRRQAATDF